ncbi:MAG TPA: ATP-grasp domain-containing protein [Bacillota bacterium]|nr:ATP-grasp domain-containing protein [Bacillota bacterium]
MSGWVLLTDAQQRKTLAAIRSLGKKGVGVMAGEETRWATALFSRYCARGFVYPSPKKNPGEFLSWLLDTLERYPCDVLFPMDDSVLEVVAGNRELIARHCKVPIPEKEVYDLAADKAVSVTLAGEAGLDRPETVIPRDFDELKQGVSRLDFPVVVKPRKSSGSRGMQVVSEEKDLADVYMKVHKEHPRPLVQEYLGIGDKYDVCLLFDRSSKLKASFVQKEIRHFPIGRGPSTVQESVWRPDLVEKAARLLQKMKWYGVAEVEFMVDPRDGKEKFMEINPRFWGSLHMSILAGVDFPWLLYRLAVDGDVEEVFTYTAGLKCRWLLPGDILHFIFNKKRFSMNPPFFTGRKSGVHDDILSLEDPLPAAGFFLACLRYTFDLEMWKFMFRR